jgi:hypothetical protein
VRLRGGRAYSERRVMRAVRCWRSLKGDSKAAIDAAVSMIPASGLAKDALTTAAALVKSKT